MSLILDALRKSEAERQRGKSPGLFASTPGVQRETFARMKLWPVLVFLAFLMASAWVIWRGEARRAQSEQAASAVASSDELGVEVVQGTNVADLADPVAPRTTSPALVAPPTLAQQRADQPTPSMADQASTTLPQAASQPASVQPLPTLPSSPTPPAPTSAPSEPAIEALPTLAVLDAGARASLPPLKLSMHVWSREPAKRFAIIDGKRVSEGALLGNGIVEEIRRDGVVLNLDGQRLLVPKP